MYNWSVYKIIIAIVIITSNQYIENTTANIKRDILQILLFEIFGPFVILGMIGKLTIFLLGKLFLGIV